MKQFLKSCVIGALSFVAGYAYCQVKDGKPVHWESPNKFVVIDIPSSGAKEYVDYGSKTYTK